MSALFISQITIKDAQKFEDYLSKSKQVASQYGAELVFAGGHAGTLNKTAHAHERVVVVRFKDVETIHRWHDSAEYQALIPLREESSDQLITVYAAPK